MQKIIEKINEKYDEILHDNDIVGVQEAPWTDKVRPIRVVINDDGANAASADSWEHTG